MQDIMARKQAEEALRRSDEKLRELNASLERRVAERTAELEETNAELAAFAHSVSHDLRAPLRAMEGFAAALAEDYGHELDDNAREYIEHIGTAAKRMDTLVDDLLAYSRLGRKELHLYPIGLNLIVREALNQLELGGRPRDVDINVAEEMPKVLGHKSTLVQITANLLSNGMKFVAQGVRPKLQVWAETRDEDVVRLWVVDNGIGIEDKNQDCIFSLLERLHGIESYPGTGIGLAIVARACERLGGRCGVESKPGEGSRFWVEFPRA